jgi:superfamily II RNA helicase
VTSFVVEEKDRKGNESLVDGSWSHGIDVSNMSYIPTSVMWQWLGMQVFLKSLQSGPKEAASVVSESPPAISSAFTPSYNLLLNLVSKYSLPQVKEILQRSFSDHVVTKDASQLDRKIKQCQKQKQLLEDKLFQVLYINFNSISLSFHDPKFSVTLFSKPEDKLQVKQWAHSTLV